MTGHDWTQLDVDDIDARRLILLLQRNGWEPFGGRPDLYSRYRLPDLPQADILVPLNEQMKDYGDLLREAVARLVSAVPLAGSKALDVLGDLGAPPGDEVKFRKQARTIKGAVAWSIGEDLIQAARDGLIAGAKARLSKQAYFGNTSGTFANRFLDSVLMGQTQEGSYVVTAYAPPTRMFPERVTRDETSPPLPEVATYSGRAILQSFSDALAATSAALRDYSRNGSLDVFVEAVPDGVSRELVAALEGLTVDSDGAEVTIDWSPDVEAIDETLMPTRVSAEFLPTDAPILERAAVHLAATEPPQAVRLVGSVRVVSRPTGGGHGVVRLQVVSGSDARTVSVRLSESDFHVAADAIANEQLLTVSGRQEKEGRRHWLYDASSVQIVESPDPTPTVSRRPNPNMPGQEVL